LVIYIFDSFMNSLKLVARGELQPARGEHTRRRIARGRPPARERSPAPRVGGRPPVRGCSVGVHKREAARTSVGLRRREAKIDRSGIRWGVFEKGRAEIKKIHLYFRHLKRVGGTYSIILGF
jgi:hypothetical protein